MTSATKVFTGLWNELTPRQKEILTGRFGLDKSGERQTLAALGARYGVTRERVRQIEAAGIALLKTKIANDEVSAEMVARARKFLKENGGVAREEALLADLNKFVDGLTRNHLALFLESSKSFFHYPEDRHFASFYYLDKDHLKAATAFVQQWASVLKSKRSDIFGGHYGKELEAFVKKSGAPAMHAASWLSITKKITTSSYGDVGLAEWAEIQPKTVRDRIYLTLKKKGEPLHFRAIAKLINEQGLARPASAPTVHNELIKDERFVLVGRGTYALAEHGYEPGTAREVIERILKKNGALRPKDIMLAVEKERFFKPNTILVNLQNKSFFKRLGDGTYKVRES